MLLLASVAWLARSHAAFGALDHVPRLVSELLDVSQALTPPQAAARGSVALLRRVLDRVDTTAALDPLLRVHWLGLALTAAVERGHLAVVQFIHELHPAPLAVQSFESAAGAGQLEVLQWLCAHRFDRLCIDVPPAQRDAQSMACCFRYQCEGAAKRGNHFHVLQWLYEAGYLQELDGMGDAAAAAGDTAMVEWLHARDVPGAFTNAAIDSAARHGHLEIVAFLHQHRQEGATTTTLMATMAAGHEDVAEYLRQNGIATVISPETIVSMAASHGNIDLLEEFRSFLDDDDSREVALDIAVANGKLEVARWLGRHPVSTDALSKAAMDGHMEMLKWVHDQELGAWTSDVFAQAALAGQQSVIQWAHVNRNELLTTTVLDCAASAGHLDLLQWLHDKTGVHCSTNAMDDAATNGHLAVVQWLHEKAVGYTVNCTDGAAQRGHLEMLIWLYHHGYDRISANAMRSGSLDVVMWLHDHAGLPIDPGAVIRSIALGDLMFIKWIHAHTTVRVSPRLLRIVLPMGHPHMLAWMREHRPTEFGAGADAADDDADDWW